MTKDPSESMQAELAVLRKRVEELECAQKPASHHCCNCHCCGTVVHHHWHTMYQYPNPYISITSDGWSGTTYTITTGGSSSTTGSTG